MADEPILSTMSTTDDTNKGPGKGRKKGTTYSRRTNAKIAYDKNREKKECEQRKASFFAPHRPRQPTPSPTNVEMLHVTQLDSEPNKNIPSTASTIMNEPTDEDPLPGVNMDNVPPLFRALLGCVMHDLRTVMKGASKGSNHRIRHTTGSMHFPWLTNDYVWKEPLFLGRPPNVADFLASSFCKAKFFAPDKTCPHLLTTGQMPCKWHGFNIMQNGQPCTSRDLFYNNFVRPFDDADGTAGFFFSSRYKCILRLRENKADKGKKGDDDRGDDDNGDDDKGKKGDDDRGDDDNGDDDNDKGDDDDNRNKGTKLDEDAIMRHPYYFTGHDPEVLKYLTPDIRNTLGLVLTKRRAITRWFSDQIFEDVASSVPFSAIQKKIAILRRNVLVQLQEKIDGFYKNPMARGSFTALAASEHRKAMVLKLSDVVGAVPSEKYLQKHFILRALKLLPYYERCLQLVSGRVLCADKSYKVIRFIFSRGADNSTVRAFDSVYSVMNEYNQIVTINFVRAGDYEEMEHILAGIQHRYRVHGYEEVRLFYSDSCCHEYKMLLRAMPSLGSRDPSRPREQDEEQLPLAQLPVRPIYITSRESFVEAALGFLQELDESGVIIPIGFDIEWDSLTSENLRCQFPETVQLAMDQPNLQRVIVVSLRQTFPQMIKDEDGNYPVDPRQWCESNSMLCRILTHPKAWLVGIGIRADVNKLSKNYPAEFVGGPRSHQVVDCRSLATKASLLMASQKKTSLEAMTATFLGRRLDKSLARSVWSARNLSEPCVNYAALDAWVGLQLYKKLESLRELHHEPKVEDLKVGDIVRLLPPTSGPVCAFGKIQSIERGLTETIGPEKRKRRYDRIMILVLHVENGQALVADPLHAADGTAAARRTVTAVAASQVSVAWNRRRMRTSTLEDLELAKARNPVQVNPSPTAVAAPSTAVVGATEATEESLPDVAGQEVQPAGEPNEENDIDAAMPDGTTIEDYPDRPLEDDGNGVDHNVGYVLISRNNNGTLQMEVGGREVFERNGVKGDPFHVMTRLTKTWPKTHGFGDEGRGLLRDALMVADPTRLDEATEQLASELAASSSQKWSGDPHEAAKEAKRRMACPSAKALQGIPRTCPEPKLLEKRFMDTVKFIANIKDHKTGDPLFSKQSWKEAKSILRHIRKGCMSDDPDVDYYYIETEPSGRQILHCIRGTSQLEGFHKHLRDIMRASHCSPLLAVCLLAVFVHRWNHDRAVQRGLASTEYKGFYQHETIHNMQLAADIHGQEQYFGDLVNPNDFESTGEMHYTPVVRHALQLVEAAIDDDCDTPNGMVNIAIRVLTTTAGNMDSQLTTTMESTTFMEQRNNILGVPVTKMTADDCYLFNELLPLYSGRRHENQFTSVDYPAMCIAHNARAMDERLKPMEQRKKIFAKTAELLKEYHKTLQKKENQRRTGRQVVEISDSTTGVTAATTVRGGTRVIRNGLNSTARSLTFREPLQAPPEPQQPMATAIQDPSERQLLFVTPPELQLAQPVVTGDGPSHIRMPAATSHPTKIAGNETEPAVQRRSVQRCYRCGWERSGNLHCMKAPSNSRNYCRVPDDQRYSYWEVPEGYNAGDELPKARIQSKVMKKSWVAIRTANSLPVDPKFPNW